MSLPLAVSRLSLVLILALGLCACGGPQEAACLVGSEQFRTELFFGLDRENASPITDAEFKSFVDTAVTPYFKSGLTIIPVDGQYLMDNGTLVHENSRIIVLLHDGSAARSTAINAIREDYKRRFQQESVLRIDSSSCVSFE